VEWISKRDYRFCSDFVGNHGGNTAAHRATGKHYRRCNCCDDIVKTRLQFGHAVWPRPVSLPARVHIRELESNDAKATRNEAIRQRLHTLVFHRSSSAVRQDDRSCITSARFRLID
jgi:hypothetical protein